MKCPKCAEAIDPRTAVPTRGEAAIAILLDWKTWAIAFVCMAVAGVVSHLLQNRGAAGGGAAVGLYVALRMGRLRKCPKCGRVDVPRANGAA